MVITAETAREMAKRSVEARQAKRLKAQAPLEPVQAETETGNTMESFARVYQEELTRRRAQLAEETDPQRIDKLCSAIFRLEQVYCRYAGIPGPGNRKPSPDKPQRQRPPMSDPQ